MISGKASKAQQIIKPLANGVDFGETEFIIGTAEFRRTIGKIQ
jgi:hypothetical protein